MLPHWLHKLRKHRYRTKHHDPRKPGRLPVCRPCVEMLEERTLLTGSLPWAAPQYLLVQKAGNSLPQSSATPVGLVPSQVRHAYGFDKIAFPGGIVGDGTGQTIAIVDAYDAPTIVQDLASFDSYLGIPAPPSFTKVAQDGSNHYPGT